MAAFDNHEIIRRKPRSILLADPADNNLWTELLLGTRGALIVTGDGPDLILRSWRDSASLEGLIWWVAGSGLRYLSTKIVAGPGLVYCPDKAREDLLAESLEVDCYTAEQRAEFAELAETDLWSQDALYTSIHEIVEDWEGSPGLKPSQCLEWTWGACRRASELLQ